MCHPSGSRYGQNSATHLVSRHLYPSIKKAASIPHVPLFRAYYPVRPCYEVQMDLLPGVYERRHSLSADCGETLLYNELMTNWKKELEAEAGEVGSEEVQNKPT